MISLKYPLFSLVMLTAVAGCASAQWSPGGEMVYMGDLNLDASSLSPLNNSSSNSSPANNSTTEASPTNATAMGQASENSSAVTEPAPSQAQASGEESGSTVLDLSSYAKDRSDKNLSGYKNIMYPISESRGSTSTTAGGGSSCGCS